MEFKDLKVGMKAVDNYYEEEHEITEIGEHYLYSGGGRYIHESEIDYSATAKLNSLPKLPTKGNEIPVCPICKSEMRIVAPTEVGYFVDGGGKAFITSYYWLCKCERNTMKENFEKYYDVKNNKIDIL